MQKDLTEMMLTYVNVIVR